MPGVHGVGLEVEHQRRLIRGARFSTAVAARAEGERGEGGRQRRGEPTHSGAQVSRGGGDSLARVLDHTLTDEHPVTRELLALIEIPKGSRNKYEYDEGIGELVLDRFLSSSMVYPTDYGFLMGHRGRDGDPLDTMVCVSEPTFPGCVIPVKPIALFKMRDEKGEDDKVVCVPTHDPGLEHRQDARRHPGGDAARDHPLLLRLQAARGQGRRGRRLALARGGARGDRRRPAPADGARRSAAQLNRPQRSLSAASPV